MSLSFLRNNLPSKKPELWRDVPAAVRRRIVAWVSNRLDPGYGWRPLLVTIEPGGLLLEVLPQEIGTRSIVFYGVYEYAPSALVRAFLGLGDTFVDVGANIGYFSMVAASLVGPDGRVVAFEPSARVRERLVRSAQLNAFDRMVVRPVAVGMAAGEVTLVEPAGDNQGLGYVVTGTGTAGLKVPSVRLDDEFEGVPVSLIKVDVEGGESAVFEGARGLLSRADAPCVLFESFQLEHDRQLLDELGFEIFTPSLEGGHFCLRPVSETIEGYRTWEAPNFFAARSARGRAFCAQHAIATR